MPVIFDTDFKKLRQWLDPTRNEWTRELQSLLKPFEGELEIYPVKNEVGKVGNNSPSFIIPLDSIQNKSNIVNIFSNLNQQATKTKSSSNNPGDGTVIKSRTGVDTKSSINQETVLSAVSLAKKRKIGSITDDL